MGRMTQITIGQALELAEAHHHAGRLAEAEGAYRRILLANPNQPDALHRLGVLLCQRKNFTEGIQFLLQAIQANPNQAEYELNLGYALNAIGRIDRAGDWESPIRCIITELTKLSSN